MRRILLIATCVMFARNINASDFKDIAELSPQSRLAPGTHGTCLSYLECLVGEGQKPYYGKHIAEAASRIMEKLGDISRNEQAEKIEAALVLHSKNFIAQFKEISDMDSAEREKLRQAIQLEETIKKDINHIKREGKKVWRPVKKEIGKPGSNTQNVPQREEYQGYEEVEVPMSKEAQNRMAGLAAQLKECSSEPAHQHAQEVWEQLVCQTAKLKKALLDEFDKIEKNLEEISTATNAELFLGLDRQGE